MYISTKLVTEDLKRKQDIECFFCGGCAAQQLKSKVLRLQAAALLVRPADATLTKRSAQEWWQFPVEAESHVPQFQVHFSIAKAATDNTQNKRGHSNITVYEHKLEFRITYSCHKIASFHTHTHTHTHKEMAGQSLPTSGHRTVSSNYYLGKLPVNPSLRPNTWPPLLSQWCSLAGQICSCCSPVVSVRPRSTCTLHARGTWHSYSPGDRL